MFDIYVSPRTHSETTYWSTLKVETVEEALEHARSLSLEWRGMTFHVSHDLGSARFGVITREHA